MERYVLSLIWVAAHAGLQRQAADIRRMRGIDAAPEPRLTIHTRLWSAVHAITRELNYPFAASARCAWSMMRVP
jgi:hypothetical protein